MTPIDDDDLRAMLDARGKRNALDPLDMVEVARRDAASAPRTGGARWRLRPAIAGLGTLAFIILAVVVVAVPLSLRPTASAAPSAATSLGVGPSSTAPSATPTLDPAADRYPGGIPRVIDGEPVLVGLDAQARWRDATDDTPFLVGGWYDSHVFNTCSGGIGPPDPNPLAARGCASPEVLGLPGRAMYPEGLDLPGDGNGPIVVRVHTRDPGAATCIPEYRAACRERTVLEAVAWFGDAVTAAAPIGGQQARRLATGVFVMEWRNQPDGGQMAVNDDTFTVPIACSAPWPTLLFAIHGDPRYGLIAVFRDTATRERFEADTDPRAGEACLGVTIERPAGPRWVGYENMLVLAYGDDAFATRLGRILVDPEREQRALDLVDPELDRSLETLNDYLTARASGELRHALGERLIPDFQEDGPGDFVVNAYAEWTADVFRRHAVNALIGDIQPLDDEPTEARVGPAAWRAVRDPSVTRARIFRVTYPNSTDSALATEEFVVIQMPESTFRDWQLLRIAGEAYPLVTPMPTEPANDRSWSPETDTPGDTPCLPAGQECP